MIFLLSLMAAVSLGFALLITYFCLKLTRNIRQYWLYWLLSTIVFTVSFYISVIITTYIVFGDVDGLFEKDSLKISFMFTLAPLSFWIMKLFSQRLKKTKYKWFSNLCIFIAVLFILIYLFTNINYYLFYAFK